MPALTAPDALLTHWDCLYGAVCERLRASAGADVPAGADGAALEDLRATVLDCVTALEQLREARVGNFAPEPRLPRHLPAFVVAQTATDDGPKLVATSVFTDAISTRGISP